MVERGIEIGKLVLSTFRPYQVEIPVPFIACRRPDRIEIPSRNFRLHVGLSLIHAYRRHRHLDLDSPCIILEREHILGSLVFRCSGNPHRIYDRCVELYHIIEMPCDPSGHMMMA